MGELWGVQAACGLAYEGEVCMGELRAAWVSCVGCVSELWWGVAAWVSCVSFVNGHGCMVEVKLCGWVCGWGWLHSGVGWLSWRWMVVAMGCMWTAYGLFVVDVEAVGELWGAWWWCGGCVWAVREVQAACGSHGVRGVHVVCIWVMCGGCGSHEEGAGWSLSVSMSSRGLYIKLYPSPSKPISEKFHLYIQDKSRKLSAFQNSSKSSFNCQFWVYPEIHRYPIRETWKIDDVEHRVGDKLEMMVLRWVRWTGWRR